jgi:hypothetical protein
MELHCWWLISRGCDPHFLTEFLAGCTHAKAEHNEIKRQLTTPISSLLRKMRALQTQVKKTADALKAVRDEPFASAFRPLNTSLFGAEFPAALDAAAAYLADSKLGIPGVRKAFWPRKLPKDLALITLCMYIREVTGSCCDAKVADLLEAAHLAHGRTRHIDPSSIARRIRRFRQQFPLVTATIVGLVEQYIETQKISKADTNRPRKNR